MTFKELMIYGVGTGIILFGFGMGLWHFKVLAWAQRKYNSRVNREEIDNLKDLFYEKSELRELKGDAKITELLAYEIADKVNVLSIEQAESELANEISFRDLCAWLVKAGVNQSNGLQKKFLSTSLIKTNPSIAQLLLHNWKPAIIKKAIKFNEVKYNGKHKQSNAPRIPSVARANENVAREVASQPTSTSTNARASNYGDNTGTKSSNFGSNAESGNIPSGTFGDIGKEQSNPTRKSKYFD